MSLPLLLIHILLARSFLSPTYHLLFASARPQSFPIAVRSPYLNTWLTVPPGDDIADNSLLHHSGKALITLGLVQVDNTSENSTYSFLHATGDTVGRRMPKASFDEDASTLTATQTTMVLTAGPIRLRVTYLSPVEPKDWVKQSFPFSYVAMQAESADGLPHAVSLYIDIRGEWVADQKDEVTWEVQSTTKSIFQHFRRTDPLEFWEEKDGMGGNEVMYLATRLSRSVSWRSGGSAQCRQAFINNGRLPNSIQLPNTAGDSGSTIVEQNGRIVTALSIDLGQVTSITEPAVFAIGQARDPAVRFQGVERSSYFWPTYNGDISKGIDAFLEDYPNAKKRADELDERIRTDAAKVSPQYAELLALGTRQVLAATELTISRGTDGGWNHSDVKMFMREMGTGKSVSPVPLVYAAYPAFLYLNASLAGRLLEPLLESQWNQEELTEYSALNLGTSYPDAPGNYSAAVYQEGVEHSGSMIIMALAHAMFSGDGTLLSRYYPLLKRWGDFLLQKSLYPTDQVSADTSQKRNATNLAIKGIIAIQALAEISLAVEQDEDHRKYSGAAASMAHEWARVAFTGAHLTSVYGESSSGGLMYNLFADKLLRTKLVADSIHAAQSEYYRTQVADSSTNLKPPLESSGDLSSTVRTHWTMMAAASSEPSGRDALINAIHDIAFNPEREGFFPTLYIANTGQMEGGAASGAQGALYSILALQLEPQTIITTPFVPSGSAPGDGSDKGPNVGAIVGGVIGGLAATATLFGVALVLKRRRDRHRHGSVPTMPAGTLRETVLATPLPHPSTAQIEPVGFTSAGKRSRPSYPVKSQPSSSNSASGSAAQGVSEEVTMGPGRDSDATAAALVREVASLRDAVGELVQRNRVGELPPQYVETERDAEGSPRPGLRL